MIIENGIVAKAITYLENQTPQKPFRYEMKSCMAFDFLLYCTGLTTRQESKSRLSLSRWPFWPFSLGFPSCSLCFYFDLFFLHNSYYEDVSCVRRGLLSALDWPIVNTVKLEIISIALDFFVVLQQSKPAWSWCVERVFSQALSSLCSSPFVGSL